MTFILRYSFTDCLKSLTKCTCRFTFAFTCINFNSTTRTTLSGLYKTIILDELNPTVDLELLPVESIHQTLLKKPAETEVVITGRCKNEPSYFELADVYSEMVCHKHYANVGVDLKRGVDY